MDGKDFCPETLYILQCLKTYASWSLPPHCGDAYMLYGGKGDFSNNSLVSNFLSKMFSLFGHSLLLLSNHLFSLWRIYVSSAVRRCKNYWCHIFLKNLIFIKNDLTMFSYVPMAIKSTIDQKSSITHICVIKYFSSKIS